MTQFRVLTAREQASVTKALEKANNALLLVNAIIAGEVKVRKTRKTRKPRKAKEVAAPAPAGKRKPGRPAKPAPTVEADI